MLHVGDTLQQGRYRVRAQLGSGGMGAVYEVFDQRLQTQFALKEAFARTVADQTQFEREAQLLARLIHPNLPRVIDYFGEGGGFFLVMELVPGDDLETMLQRQGQPFAVGLVLQWADQLLDALQYLHQPPPVIHRDIKLSNLKIDHTGRIKLLDFGIAKQAGSSSRTATAAQAVSAPYSPLEQWQGLLTDERSDIYALGATLYYLLTNHAPTPALYRSNGQPLPSPRTFNPACSPALAQILLRAMALNPAQRFQSAHDFAAALRGMPSATITVSTVAMPQRRRWWLGLLALVLVVGGGAGTFMLEPQWLNRSVVWGGQTATPVIQPSSIVSAAAATSTPLLASASEVTPTSRPPVIAVTAMQTVTSVPTELPTPQPTATTLPAPTSTSLSVSLPSLSADDSLKVPDQRVVPLREQPDAAAATVYERPLLFGGALVTLITQQADWLQVRTPEGVIGWVASSSLQDATAADQGMRRFADGSQVIVKTPRGVGIPLRAQPVSSATKVMDLLRDGEVLTVTGELGDWLELQNSAGVSGWGRWYYNGEQYLHAR